MTWHETPGGVAAALNRYDRIYAGAAPASSTSPSSAEFEVPWDDFAPRNEEERYRIYLNDGFKLTLLACTPEAEGIGPTLLTLDADAREAGSALSEQGLIGINDGLERRWIIKPYSRGSS